MKLADGHKLGRYEIRSLIGVGGMGEVYRANDPKIGRDVAIKGLPADFSADKERVARFEQEAQAAGALNHPNILAIHDVDTQDGVLYVVSELLEGEELRQRLDEGPIPLRKVTEYAQQIVSGLSAAHEKGIVHRDLKPENLFITNDDRVKILDFGLAKLSEPGAAATGSEDATRKAMTNPGVVMGTAGYMSPEQVRGHATDHRSDVFSFGVILYEMLTGKRAFQGDSVVEMMHSILKADIPDLNDTDVKIPPALEKLMRRCLEKKPEHRFHSAHDLGFALDALSTSTSSSGSGMAAAASAAIEEEKLSPWRSRVPWLIAALFLASTAVVSMLYIRRPEPLGQTMRFSIPPPEKTGFAEASAISPDGHQVTFIAQNSSGETSLWVRPLLSVDARQLTGTEGASFPFWSPDSRFLGFFAGGKLRKIEAVGGPIQTLADASSDPRGGTWATDGTIIFSPGLTSPLLRISSSGGTAAPVTVLDADKAQISHRWPSMMPDGKHVIYFGRGNQPEMQGLYAASIDSPVSKFIIQTPVMGSYVETQGKGFLLFVKDSTLMAQPFDAGKLELSGEAAPIVPGLRIFPGETGPTAFASFSAAGGRLLYRTGDPAITRLEWFDRSGKSLGAITDAGDVHEPSLSPDGTKIIYGRGGSGGSDTSAYPDIFLLDTSRGNTSRLTFDPASQSSSVFSPDGSQAAFASFNGNEGSINVRASNGSGGEESILSQSVLIFPDSWSRDGKYILYEMNAGSKTKFDLWILPMFGDRTPFPYLETEFVESHAQFSPDGRWISYGSDESGRAEVYIQSFPIGGGKWQISTAGGDQPQWRGDGKELFYIAPDRALMSVKIGGGSSLDVGRPEPLFQAAVPLTGLSDDRNNYVPTQDGQRFVIKSLANAENTQPLTLVLNWAADLKK